MYSWVPNLDISETTATTQWFYHYNAPWARRLYALFIRVINLPKGKKEQTLTKLFASGAGKNTSEKVHLGTQAE